MTFEDKFLDVDRIEYLEAEELELKKIKFFEIFYFLPRTEKKIEKEFERVLFDFFNQKKFKVSIDGHYIKFLKNDIIIEIWRANKFYSYCSNIHVYYNKNYSKFSFSLRNVKLSRKLMKIIYSYEKAVYNKHKEERDKQIEKEQQIKKQKIEEEQQIKKQKIEILREKILED